MSPGRQCPSALNGVESSEMGFVEVGLGIGGAGAYEPLKRDVTVRAELNWGSEVIACLH